MFVSCVPIARKKMPFSSAIAETASPTPDERQPVKTSTFSCEIKRFASFEPIAGWFVSSPRTISKVMREFFLLASSTASCRPVCCDSDAAAYTPENPSMWPIFTVRRRPRRSRP
jgi:hypothetical protein